MDKWSLLVASFLLATVSSSSTAGVNEGAKIAGHLVDHVAQKGYDLCSNAPLPPCNSGEENLNTLGATQTHYDLYLMVVDGDSTLGIGGAGFGIDYKGSSGQGMDVFGWTLCADAEYGSHSDAPSWPNANSGNVITWTASNCQKQAAAGDVDGGVTAVLGVFYVYAYGNDTFKITKRPLIATPET